MIKFHKILLEFSFQLTHSQKKVVEEINLDLK